MCVQPTGTPSPERTQPILIVVRVVQLDIDTIESLIDFSPFQNVSGDRRHQMVAHKHTCEHGPFSETKAVEIEWSKR